VGEAEVRLAGHAGILPAMLTRDRTGARARIASKSAAS
jgi:hypothetical protein